MMKRRASAPPAPVGAQSFISEHATNDRRMVRQRRGSDLPPPSSACAAAAAAASSPAPAPASLLPPPLPPPTESDLPLTDDTLRIVLAALADSRSWAALSMVSRALLHRVPRVANGIEHAVVCTTSTSRAGAAAAMPPSLRAVGQQLRWVAAACPHVRKLAVDGAWPTVWRAVRPLFGPALRQLTLRGYVDSGSDDGGGGGGALVPLLARDCPALEALDLQGASLRATPLGAFARLVGRGRLRALDLTHAALAPLPPLHEAFAGAHPADAAMLAAELAWFDAVTRGGDDDEDHGGDDGDDDHLDDAFDYFRDDDDLAELDADRTAAVAASAASFMAGGDGGVLEELRINVARCHTAAPSLLSRCRRHREALLYEALAHTAAVVGLLRATGGVASLRALDVSGRRLEQSLTSLLVALAPPQLVECRVSATPDGGYNALRVVRACAGSLEELHWSLVEATDKYGLGNLERRRTPQAQDLLQAAPALRVLSLAHHGVSDYGLHQLLAARTAGGLTALRVEGSDSLTIRGVMDCVKRMAAAAPRARQRLQRLELVRCAGLASHRLPPNLRPSIAAHLQAAAPEVLEIVVVE